MRRDIDEFIVSPEHLDKCSYEVLTCHYRLVKYVYSLGFCMKMQLIV